MTTSTSKGLRQDIQQLRGIAVLAVIINHLGVAWLPGGYLGVDMFFVVSGFVITLSMLSGGSSPESRTHFFVHFWIRRMFRLWPMLFVTVIVTTAVLLVTGLGLPGPLMTGLFSLVGASNLRLVLGRLDYFALDTSNDWYMHTWSLAVEEQVYLVLSLLFMMLGIASQRKKSKHSRMVRVKYAVALISLLSLIMGLSFSTSELVRFYSPHTRFYQIGAGVLLAFLNSRGASESACNWLVGRRTLLVAAISGIALLFWIDTPSGRISSLLVTVATSLILVLSTPNHRKFGLLRLPLLNMIGDRSYSLYLVHWPVQLLWSNFATNTVLQISGSLLTTFLLGTLGFRFIETPTRRMWQTRSVARASGLAMIGLFVTGCIVATSFFVVERTTRPTSMATPTETCSKMDSSVWVIGDSHFKLAPQEAILASILASDCRYLGGYGLILDFEDLARDSTGQRGVRMKLISPERLISQIQTSRNSPQVLFIVHFLTAFLSKPEAAPPSADFVAIEWEDSNGRLVPRETFLDLFLGSLDQIAGALARHSGVLVVTSPPPDFDWIRYPIPNGQCGRVIGRLCNQYRTEAKISLDQHNARGLEVRQSLDRLALTHANVIHLPLDKPFCDSEGCSNFSDTNPLYMDDDHLNYEGARLVSPLYEKTLADVLP